MASPALAVGDEVELVWSHNESPPYPGLSRLTVRQADEVVFFYMHRGALPDGFSSEWGDVQCQGAQNCLVWDSKKLRLTGPCADTVEVGTGEHAELCDLDVYPGTLQYRLPEPETEPAKCGTHAFVGIELTLLKAQR